MTRLTNPFPIRTRTGGACFAAAISTAVLAPMINLWREKPRDSFPLSHYPMFSARRGTHVEVAYLRGVLADGGHVMLDSKLIARGGMNQERKQIARAARRDRGQRLAEKAARTLARRDSHLDVVATEIVVGQFLLANYFEPGPMLPEQVRLVGHQEVPGRVVTAATSEGVTR